PLLIMLYATWDMQNSHSNYRPLLERYSRYAPRYDQRFARYNAATLSTALEMIPGNGERTLLDVACGTGILIQMLQQRRPQLRITGVDITPEMLERARQRIPEGNGVPWTLGHAEHLQVDDPNFD